jgi:hypothetical protein
MTGNEEVAIMYWTCHTVELSQMLRGFASHVGERIARRVRAAARRDVSPKPIEDGGARTTARRRPLSGGKAA